MSDETKIFTNAPFDPNQKNDASEIEAQPVTYDAKRQKLKALLAAGLSTAAVGGGYLFWSKTKSESEAVSTDPNHPVDDVGNHDSNPIGVELDSTFPNVGGTSNAPIDEVTNINPNEDHSENIPDAHPVSNNDDVPDAILVIFTEAPVADSVVDAMSFDEAFATARAQVGPGGFFEWNNEFYNTYYKEEWDGMSPDRKQAYLASIIDKIDSSSDDFIPEVPVIEVEPEENIPDALPTEEVEIPDSNFDDNLDDGNTVIIEAGEEPFIDFNDTPDIDNDADISEWTS